jgi:dipeptidyl aminopeptidase/acylaminoacyl peptidase
MRHTSTVLAGLALAVALLPAAAPAAAKRPKPLPTPVATITDPRSVESPSNPLAAPVPIRDLSGIRGLRGAAWTRDGRAVVISTNLTGRFNLWRVDLGVSFPSQLTQSEEAQIPVDVTPDGLALYLEDRGGDENYDLYAVPVNGGPPVNLTNTPEFEENSPQLSRDGALVALMQRPTTGAVRNLAVLDRKSGQIRRLTDEQDAARAWQPIGWSPDGRTLYATRGSIDSSRAAIYRIDVASGAATALTTEAPGVYVEGRDVSPDGRLIALMSNEKTGQLQAGLLDLQTGTTRWLKPTPWEQYAGSFSPDGAYFVVQTNADGRADLSVADVATLTEKPLQFPPGYVGEGTGSSNAWRPGTAGLLVRRNGGDSPSDLYVVDPATGASERITRLPLASLDPAKLPKTRLIAYRSYDGTPISAVLTIPANLRRDGSNAAVVIPHGGPTGQSLDTFSADATALASRGYFVIRPNFRGSTGYGRAFQEANRKDLGGGDLEDVVAAAKFLVDTGYVHPKRIGITGGSYGGYMTLMALGRKPDVFAAGVNLFGIINWFTMWENSLGGLREYQRALIGDPETNREGYLRMSPMTYAPQIRSPLLTLQGENDVRVPKGQADEVMQLVKKHGGIGEAVYYPAEGHGFAKLENAEDARRRMVQWFETHLQPQPAPAATAAR